MRKWIFCLCVLLVSFPSEAQKNLWKGIVRGTSGSKAVPSLVHQSLPAGARYVQGKILFAPKLPPKYSADLEKYVFKSIQNEDRRPILALYDPTDSQRAELTRLYRRVMASFDEFKKEMDVFLYYQAHASERRVVVPAERAALLKKMNAVNRELARLRHIVSTNDPDYEFAQDYMIYAAENISPELRGMLRAPSEDRTDRTFSMQEFFLHTPQQSSFGSALSHLMPNSLRIHQAMQDLPDQLNVAVLNDDSQILSKIRKSSQHYFQDQWKVYTYDNAEYLLTDVSEGRIQVDLILTDLLVPGGGGYYLVSALREREFEGIVLALSAYQESSQMGKLLFEYGFDGMISVTRQFAQDPEGMPRLWEKVRNYFYYSKQNGWTRGERKEKKCSFLGENFSWR